VRAKSEGMLESSLYFDDVAGSAVFYERIFGFQIISDFGERGCATQAGTRQVVVRNNSIHKLKRRLPIDTHDANRRELVWQ
jgi:hypothetical protein